MRLLRLFPVALLALAVAIPTVASGQGSAPTIPLPGGGQIKVKLPQPKPANGKAKKNKGKARSRTSKVQVGIADEKPQMFSDERFRALGLKTARRSVAWDVFEFDWALAEVDEWMHEAQAAGVRPLITFGRSRVN